VAGREHRGPVGQVGHNIVINHIQVKEMTVSPLQKDARNLFGYELLRRRLWSSKFCIKGTV
jgi:hypothetical protein